MPARSSANSMRSSPRRGTRSFKGRSIESTSKSDTSQTSPGQRRTEVMALPISKGPKRGIYYAQCRYKGRSGESKKKVQAQAQDRKGSVQLGIRAPGAHEGRTQHAILRVLRGLCGGREDVTSANHARGQDRYEQNKSHLFQSTSTRTGSQPSTSSIKKTSSWTCGRIAGSYTRRSTCIRSAVRYSPCSTMLRARIESNGEGQQDRQQASR